MLKYSIAFILSITSIYITPRLFDSFNLVRTRCCYIKSEKKGDNSKALKTNRIRAVMVLRSLSTIVIPLAVSMVFVNGCGSYWLWLWNKCNDDKKHLFYVDGMHPLPCMNECRRQLSYCFFKTLKIPVKTKDF